MRAAIFNGPGSISLGERPDAAIHDPTATVVRVVMACVCGSDLWYSRGETPFEPGPIGHDSASSRTSGRRCTASSGATS